MRQTTFKKIIGFSLLFIFCMPSFCIANDEGMQDFKSGKIMQKVSDAIKNIKTYKQTIKSYKYGKLISEGTVYHKEPGKFYETTKVFTNDGKNFEYTRINDGACIWAYNPFTQLITKEKKKPSKIPKNITFMKDENGIYSRAVFKKEDKFHYIFDIKRWQDNSDKFSTQKTETFYRKDIGYPDKVIFYDYEGNKETEMLSIYSDINKPIDDSMVIFKPLAGIPITNMEEGKGPVTVRIEGTRTTPDKIFTKNEILTQADKFAKDLDFEIEKCEKNIREENGKWKVEYYNKLGHPRCKFLFLQYNEKGEFVSMHRSPE